MKAHLMYKDRDFDPEQRLAVGERANARGRELDVMFNSTAGGFGPKANLRVNESDLTQDLELNTLFNAMAQGDNFLFAVAKQALLTSLNDDPATILYRQNILKDCLRNPSIVKEIYNIALESVERERRSYFSIFSRYTASVLHSAIEVMQIFIDMLRKLSRIADEHADKFTSEGFTVFFAMLKNELSGEYFARVESYLRELKFRHGVLISAELGKGNKGDHYVLRRAPQNRQRWIRRIFAQKPPEYTFQLHPRDESGGRYLGELRDRGINLVSNALAQSAEHILSFFSMMGTELAFYIGCMNLYRQLAQMGEPVTFPVPVSAGEARHSFRGLYDVCLALSMKQKVVGNDGNADSRRLVIITGANQGGKSTFLRSIGLAQLMMQCGMFVAAEAFCANLCDRLFTHYKREEDITMKSGKFDEELSRMSEIVDHITPNSLVLFNESFAATTEREGSEIARQIVRALLEKGVKMFFVSHFYEFAGGIYRAGIREAMFLRAERHADGARTFKLIEGEPLETSYGADLYKRIFKEEDRALT